MPGEIGRYEAAVLSRSRDKSQLAIANQAPLEATVVQPWGRETLTDETDQPARARFLNQLGQMRRLLSQHVWQVADTHQVVVAFHHGQL